jgi:hypothetical protein
MRLAQALEPCLSNAFGEPKKSNLHVGGKRGDFRSDHFVEDFDSPRHSLLYLNFEIAGSSQCQGRRNSTRPLVAGPP